mmetsp:Transcript_36460/g.81963  ORF Transcript_36460/g.81963 Transcript_36460/m.81963 type:complete len:459 (-) Transcript_36460:60-1436(-)
MSNDGESIPLLVDDRKNDDGSKDVTRSAGASAVQTSINISKMCAGTGTLALPFAAEQGGLAFHLIGLFLIAAWDYKGSEYLLRSHTLIQATNNDQMLAEWKEPGYGNTSGSDLNKGHLPPDGTTMYGTVAWYAAGPTGLKALDVLMLSLFLGLLISYEVVMLSFIEDMPFTTGSRKADLLVPSLLVATLSCAPDVGFLSRFSVLGLLALALSFCVIAWQGFHDNGWEGFESQSLSSVTLWPESMAHASSWFGVVVFGYGVAPFIFNIRDSMAEPEKIGTSLRIGLGIVYIGYIVISNGIVILFSPSYEFRGDVLQAMPGTRIALFVRVLMTLVVAVTAPLIVVPCGEMIEGKLGIDSYSSANGRVLVRVTLCTVCTFVAVFVPGFVRIVSFIGCFSVSIVGFVLPPLFCLLLEHNRANHKVIQEKYDGSRGILLRVLLTLGLVTSAVTTSFSVQDFLS